MVPAQRTKARGHQSRRTGAPDLRSPRLAPYFIIALLRVCQLCRKRNQETTIAAILFEYSRRQNGSRIQRGTYSICSAALSAETFNNPQELTTRFLMSFVLLAALRYFEFNACIIARAIRRQASTKQVGSRSKAGRRKQKLRCGACSESIPRALLTSECNEQLYPAKIRLVIRI